ncbi:hypothetical protein PG991_010636 [Apiospora marii]|uniref:Apple domain-containing protein n=1 Tax=Apiospora marii TaxID=335849 RepID=A0ABR1RC65_9PEZI
MEHNPHGHGATTEKYPADGMQHDGGVGYGQPQQSQQQYHEQQQQYHQQQQYVGNDPHAMGQYPPSAAGGYAATQGPAHPSKSGSSGTILGMKRGLFWALMLLLLLLLGLVIGLAAGLGVSQSNLHAKESELAAAKSLPKPLPSNTSPTAFITVSPAATASGAQPTATSTHPTGSADKYSCLSNGGTANNTEYTSEAASAATQFKVYCGMDFGDQEGAKNLDSLNATSMPDCMDACARARDCQGAGWGSLGEPADQPHMCYLKTNLSKSHGAEKGWTFAVLASVNVTLSSPSKS